MRILVVEDNTEAQNLLQAHLEKRRCIVDSVADGEIALLKAKTNEYDILLLDFDVPRKNGFEICKEIRAEKNKTPIIMISATISISHKLQAFSLGADDYVTKPYAFEELYARMHCLLRRPQYQEEEMYQIDNLVLYTKSHKVFRGKKSIYLTRKEFLLLEKLLKHKGHVVSRAALIEYVWGNDIDDFSNTIETHIRNIRRKIEFGNQKKLIHCVPGCGYKIDVTKD